LDVELEVDGLTRGDLLDDQQRDEERADLDHEHDRVLCHDARVEFFESVADGGLDDGRVPEGLDLADLVLRHDACLPDGGGPAPRYGSWKCSTIGPSDRAGKKVSAPTMR